MPSLMSSSEEKQIKEIKDERKQIFLKFSKEMKTSFFIWLKISGIIISILIVFYLVIRFVFSWDLFYETDLNYRSIFFLLFIMFICAVGLCWLGAYFLYNTKHRRNTKYKDLDKEIGRKSSD